MTRNRPTKDAPSLNLQDVAALARALSDENRLRILLSVCSGKKTVTRIVEEVNLSQPLVSHHLRELKRALLVQVERSGPFVYYEPAHPGVLDVLEALDALAADFLANRKTL
ncbi:MAG: ArsR/SmtB-type metalloregulator TsoR [Thermodesulfobacteriota bacterium]